MKDGVVEFKVSKTEQYPVFRTNYEYFKKDEEGNWRKEGSSKDLEKLAEEIQGDIMQKKKPFVYKILNENETIITGNAEYPQISIIKSGLTHEELKKLTGNLVSFIEEHNKK